jgi:hypothetical protein
MSKKTPSISDLRNLTTIKSFKGAAKDIIRATPTRTTVQQVIDAAYHAFGNNDEVRKNLLHFLNGVKDRIERIKPEHQERFISRALRASNPTLAPPLS